MYITYGGYPMYIMEGGTRCTWRLATPLGHRQPPGYPTPPKMAQEGRFYGQNSVFDPILKELFELLKYFFGS